MFPACLEICAMGGAFEVLPEEFFLREGPVVVANLGGLVRRHFQGSLVQKKSPCIWINCYCLVCKLLQLKKCNWRKGWQTFLICLPIAPIYLPSSSIHGRMWSRGVQDPVRQVLRCFERCNLISGHFLFHRRDE